MLGYPDIKKGIKKRLQTFGDDWIILLHLKRFCQELIAKIRFELLIISGGWLTNKRLLLQKHVECLLVDQK